MFGEIVEIVEEGRYLSVHRGFLKVSYEDSELARIALDRVFAVLISARQAVVSRAVMSALAEHGAVVIFCGPTYLPESICAPYGQPYNAARRVRLQVGTRPVLYKQLWQHLVKEKIRNQAFVLDWFKPDSPVRGRLMGMMRKVQSGDARNHEAHAARVYWRSLFGRDFVRMREGRGANILLNYGYTVLRSAAARAVCGAGLVPALGIHHSNIYNPFSLADDIMEPYRPLVDACVFNAMAEIDSGEPELTPAVKRELASVLQKDVQGERGVTPVFQALHVLALSLVKSFARKKVCLSMAGLLHPKEEERKAEGEESFLP